MAKLKGYKPEELLGLLEDIYHLGEEARLYLDTKVLGKPEKPMAYKSIIKGALSADLAYGEDLEWDKADKAIKNFRLASPDDTEGLAELLVYYVEVANQFTLDYGDVDEGYYESIEESFQEAVDHLLMMDRERQEVTPYVLRLRAIVHSTDGIGWGYHDALYAKYCEAFGVPQE